MVKLNAGTTLDEHLLQAYKHRYSTKSFQQHEALFRLRTTAQQVDNVQTGWLEATAGSPARMRILLLLWAAGNQPVPHHQIVAVLQVTRATVSGLMRGLARDGLVQSVRDSQDRRSVLASLTAKGLKVADQALDLLASRVDAALKDLSTRDLEILSMLLKRLRECFMVSPRS